MLNYQFKDYHLSVFQKLRHSDTCKQVESCTKHGRPDQSQRELTVALNISLLQLLVVFSRTIPDVFNQSHVVSSDNYHGFYTASQGKIHDRG